MKKILVASVSALSLMGLAACADVDDTTTQGMEPMDTQEPAAAPDPMDEPAPAPAPVD